jgi:hypothetical protein
MVCGWGAQVHERARVGYIRTAQARGVEAVLATWCVRGLCHPAPSVRRGWRGDRENGSLDPLIW